MTAEQGHRPRKPRGVRLNDLDRSRYWVIGHTGHRWETLGSLDDVAQAQGWQRPETGAGAGGASTAPDAARQAPRALDTDPESPTTT